MNFIVETSARHIHLTEADFKTLFGDDATLTIKKMLSQPGQYACAERVTVVGPKNELAGVSILGPFRKASQVELSATDARSIGLPIVVRESGDLKGTPGCKLVGPKGELELTEGVIVAKRHIHATVNDAKELGVNDCLYLPNAINHENFKVYDEIDSRKNIICMMYSEVDWKGSKV